MDGNDNGAGRPAAEAARQAQRLGSLQKARAARWAGPRKSQAEQEARWRRQVWKAMRWAATHRAGTPTRSALNQMLLDLKESKPDAFMRLLMPMLGSATEVAKDGEPEEVAESADPGLEAFREELIRWGVTRLEPTGSADLKDEGNGDGDVAQGTS